MLVEWAGKVVRSVDIGSTNKRKFIPQIKFFGIWHNNEPFEITLMKDIPIKRNFCSYYQNEFPRGPLLIVPYDIAVKYKEKWKFLNRNRIS